jgi:hypothetical protein
MTTVLMPLAVALNPCPKRGKEISGALAYHDDRPYEVHFSIVAHEIAIHWRFARELLLEGTLHPLPQGIGQASTWLDARDRMHFRFRNPEGEVEFLTPSEPVIKFLDKTYDLVPEGEEHSYFNIDDEIALLLGGTS